MDGRRHDDIFLLAVPDRFGARPGRGRAAGLRPSCSRTTRAS